jgi:peptide/nickel transport system substrate-binding protein
MENRFGVKDVFIFGLLLIIVVMIGLCMLQYDRQWKRIGELQDATRNLATDLTVIRRQLNEGVVSTAPTAQQPGQPQGKDYFAAIKEAEKQPDFARGDWFVENFGTNIGKLTPLISTDVYATWVQAKVQETLAGRNPDTLEFVPLLAQSWERSEDGKTLAFNLRRGVVFSDGEPMTSKDVVFTFNHILNPEIDCQRSRAYFKHLESVTAEGDYRVVFKFKEFIFNTFESIAGTGIMPEHFYKKFTAREYNENPGLLMGTGAYRLPAPDTWRPGVRVELVRNERYWGTPPAIDKLVYYEVKDDTAEETMYRNREIDRFAPTPEQFIKLREDKAITDRSTIWQYYSPVSGYNYIGWNQKRAGKATIFADRRVRQAMTMLIDRERMAKEMYYGFAKPATGPFGYGSPQTDPSVTPWPYDPARAKDLLKQAGYEDRNGDGVIEAADGTSFQFTFTYSAGNAFTDRIVLFVKDSFAQAGIKVNLDAVDWPVQTKRLDTRDFEATILGWSTSIETDCNQIFHSKQTQDQGDNFVNYINPDLDKAIDEARATVDDSARMKKWNAVHRIIHEDQPYTFLLNRQANVFIDSRVKNIRKTKMGLNMVLTEITSFPWYVPEKQQLHKTPN